MHYLQSPDQATESLGFGHVFFIIRSLWPSFEWYFLVISACPISASRSFRYMCILLLFDLNVLLIHTHIFVLHGFLRIVTQSINQLIYPWWVWDHFLDPTMINMCLQLLYVVHITLMYATWHNLWKCLNLVIWLEEDVFTWITKSKWWQSAKSYINMIIPSNT